jgi:hypothetical protein
VKYDTAQIWSQKGVVVQQEVWKDIEGASNYLISNDGRVKNRKTGRYLKINRATGCPTINVRSDSGGYITRSIRVLVDAAFGKDQSLIAAPKPKNRQWMIDSEDRSDIKIDYRSYGTVEEED